MRLIYPTISSAEYVDLIRKDNTPPPVNYFNVFLMVVMGVGLYSVSYVLTFMALIMLRHVFPVLSAPVFPLTALLSLIPTTVLCILFKPTMPKKTRHNIYDTALFEYLQLCDTLRTNTVYDVSLHIVGERCRLDFEYEYLGHREKKNLDMSWHVSPGISDVVIDFERREVSIPKNMCNSLEEK